MAMLHVGNGLSAGEHADVIRSVGEGAPHLVSVDHPLVAVAAGAATDVREIRTGFWLGERDGAEELAGQTLLTPFQVRGAFANYVDRLKADFKSIAACRTMFIHFSQTNKNFHIQRTFLLSRKLN